MCHTFCLDKSNLLHPLKIPTHSNHHEVVAEEVSSIFAIFTSLTIYEGHVAFLKKCRQLILPSDTPNFIQLILIECSSSLSLTPGLRMI